MHVWAKPVYRHIQLPTWVQNARPVCLQGKLSVWLGSWCSMATGSSLAHHTHDMHSHTHTHSHPECPRCRKHFKQFGACAQHAMEPWQDCSDQYIETTSWQKHFILQYVLMTCQNVPEPNMMISIVHNVSSCFWPNQDRLGSHGAWRPCANHKNI